MSSEDLVTKNLKLPKLKLDDLYDIYVINDTLDMIDSAIASEYSEDELNEILSESGFVK